MHKRQSLYKVLAQITIAIKYYNTKTSTSNNTQQHAHKHLHYKLKIRPLQTVSLKVRVPANQSCLVTLASKKKTQYKLLVATYYLIRD